MLVDFANVTYLRILLFYWFYWHTDITTNLRVLQNNTNKLICWYCKYYWYYLLLIIIGITYSYLWKSWFIENSTITDTLRLIDCWLLLLILLTHWHYSLMTYIADISCITNLLHATDFLILSVLLILRVYWG